MKVIKKLMVPSGEYTDKQTGETKASWLKIGVLQSDGNNNFKVKLDSIPVGNFSGWVECFDIEPRQGGEGRGQSKMADWD